MCTAVGSASAQSLSGEDGSLTVHGITVYGIVDLGLRYLTKGAPQSDFLQNGTAPIVQKNSRESVFSDAPNNLSQSRVGLKGLQELGGGWSGVFKLETFFNPQSGELSDGLKSLVLNNGRPLANQDTAADSVLAGQAFAGEALAGIGHAQFGTLTFGRQKRLTADGVSLFDPMGASNAFSVIGFSGIAAGGGDSENRILDSSLKYAARFGLIDLGAQYQFGRGAGSTADALDLQLGVTIPAGSVEVYYSKKRDAILASSLTAAQVAELPNLGYSNADSLLGSVSDNTARAIMGKLRLGPPMAFAGYGYIHFANPSSGLIAGTETIGGYVLAFVNNAPYPHDRILQIFWVGLKYPINQYLDVIGVYYGYHQSSYAAGSSTGCSSNSNAGCSGNLNGYSLVVDYRLNRRFDFYAGAMMTGVKNGLAFGYLSTSTLDPTLGVRFAF